MADPTLSYAELLRENASLRALLAEREARSEHRAQASEQARLDERLRRVAAETALHESEARYRTLADTMPQVVFIATASGFVEYVNQPGLEYMGLPLDQAIGFGWLDAVHPDDRRLVADRWLECLKIGKTYEFEHRLLRVDGQYRWQLARAVPIGGETGAVVRWIGTSTDIHDHRQIEQDLLESRTEAERSHAFIRQIIDTDPNFIFAKDRDGRFTLVNQAVADCYGTTVEELIGKTDADFNPNVEEVAHFQRKDREVIDGLRDAFIPEEVITDASGNVRWLQTVKRPILNEQGKATHVLGVATDITQRRLAEEALRRNEELLRLVTDSSPIAMVYCDAQQRLQFVNRAYADRFGLAPADVIGTHIADVVGVKAYETIRPYVDAALVGTRSDFEMAVPYERIGTRYMRCAYVPHMDQGGRAIGFTAVLSDITDRRRMEETLRESEERLRSFAQELEARVAERTQELTQLHARLRALSTDLNLTEQRERKRLATDLHDYLAQLLALVRMKLGQIKRLIPNTAQAEVTQTEGIVNEALIYTRTLVAQLCPPVLHEFGLPLALRWLAEQMLRQELTVEVRQLVHDRVLLPEDQAVLLFQSVRELLINVRKHARTNQAVMAIEQSGDDLCITVRDEGAGMDLSAAQATNQLSVSSSKFGLFSIRERMLAIGGRLELDSSPGRGMTSRLIVPITDRRPAVEESESPASGDAPPTIQSHSVHEEGRIRVLLVDDHPMIREGLRGLLYVHEDLSIVGEARDGEEALSLTDKLRPDCVIMDVNMPRMDGIEATRRLKAAFAGTAVIGLSVNASREVELAMRRAGVDQFLSKAAPVEQIYRTIVGTAKKPD